MPVAVAPRLLRPHNKTCHGISAIGFPRQELVDYSWNEYTDDVAMVLWMAVEAAVDSMKNGTKGDGSTPVALRSRCRGIRCARGGLTPLLSSWVTTGWPQAGHGCGHMTRSQNSFTGPSFIRAQTSGDDTSSPARRCCDSWGERNVNKHANQLPRCSGSVDIDRFRADDSGCTFPRNTNLIGTPSCLWRSGLFPSSRDYPALYVICPLPGLHSYVISNLFRGLHSKSL